MKMKFQGDFGVLEVEIEASEDKPGDVDVELSVDDDFRGSFASITLDRETTKKLRDFLSLRDDAPSA